MTGVPRRLAEHSINIIKSVKPVKQTLRHFSEPKNKAIGEEIAQLLAAGLIKEVLHPKWLANPVLGSKKNKSWCMCIDFKDVNHVCPKDHFPLPRMDQIVESTAGCEKLCFLDAYSGHHQIRMKSSD